MLHWLLRSCPELLWRGTVWAMLGFHGKWVLKLHEELFNKGGHGNVNVTSFLENATFYKTLSIFLGNTKS